MFCYQCEQTYRPYGCTDKGVCGKDAETALLQDLVVDLVKDLARYAYRAGALGVQDDELNLIMLEALFTTVTNVNFDPARVAEIAQATIAARARAKQLYAQACADNNRAPETVAVSAISALAETLEGQVAQAKSIAPVAERIDLLNDDATALQDLLLFGIKGAAAYAHHAHVQGYDNQALYDFFYKGLNALAMNEQDIDTLIALCLECGEVNLKTMELLDQAHTETYGHPQPTAVRVTPVAGKAILVSGHDLKDLELLLKQTEGKGINIYTHGEMLPAHGYPGLHKYPHLVGNYGGAWQKQKAEFDAFPGAILMTTNCIQEPAESYKDRLFTTGLVAWPDVEHIADKDFSAVIEAALAQPGFAESEPEHTIMVGFGHNAVLSVADKVIDGVKQGAIKHFFLIGGCDGARSGRNYFTEMAQTVPDDCVILTLACGKYRFNKLEFGDIGGIPRLLDIGQCNDAYSAIKIASALANAFECGVNDLPLSLIVSWYEQKAVAILLSLLYLDIKNIRLGPSLPAFVSSNVLQVLVEKFGLAPITTVEEDLQAFLN
ncbi:MAG: hydroxylamine reductase [Anaerolineae bacterium]|nr:hydroxylamine reductase [Anaerolineae bacterium]